MKRSVIIIALVCITARIFAQDCSQYVFMKRGRTIETTSYKPTGGEMYKAVMLVSDVTTTGNITIATLQARNYNAEGKSVGNNTISYKCDNGSLSIDLSSIIPSQGSVKFNSSAILKYPSHMHVGETFDNVSLSMVITMGNKSVNSDCKITDRKIVGEESVTTPAGTWKCYKFTYNIATTITGSNIPSRTIPATEWFAPGFGLVQWQIGAIKANITAIKD